MDFRISLLGLFVGVLIGLTGMGGGAIMTPALILFGIARPALAVGTDLAWNALTKGVGSIVHLRQQTVNTRLVKRLAIGSIPGALCGITLLAILRHHGIKSEDHLVVMVLGTALIGVALSLFFRTFFGSKLPVIGPEGLSRGPAWLISVLGLIVGFLVSITSVGSGSVIVASLVFIYPTTPLKKLVGSDILHGLLLVGVSAIGHMGLGTVDTRLLIGLLIGSVPGVVIGSRLSAIFPERLLRPMLATTLLYLGARLL
ncbi:MAG TPA: sulfite exporter TauE/SafE family protein [Terriglobia bacterium]|nr:sulfite exporter TauE/SafE family protein [Terriglobia bacterium]